MGLVCFMVFPYCMNLRIVALLASLAGVSLGISGCSKPGLETMVSESEGEHPLPVNIGDASESWSFNQIAALPSESFTFDDGSYFDGRSVKVVRMATFWKSVDPEGTADVMTAYCKDKYFSVYTREFVDTYNPFIIYEVDGDKPSAWKDGLENASPFFISCAFEEGTPPYQDKGHKQPWGVESVSFGKYDEMFAAFYTGDFEELSHPATEGRSIWINSCASCHEGPANGIGGHKATRPWEVLAIHAQHNEAYFVNYTRDPKRINPMALMEPHPQYSDEQMAALVAFLTTGK